MPPKIVPNFFIIGAPKCGTTALVHYLRQHNQIFVCRSKEPHYFASDFDNYRSVKTFEAYEKLFTGCSAEHIAAGEASTWYLFSKTATKNIYDFNPEAKIIIMIRNPVDLVYSLHSQLLYSFHEDQKDFRKAWDLQAERSRNEGIPRSCRQPELLQYAQVGMLHQQIDRVLKIFPRFQVKILLFEDFTSNTRATYSEVLSFLGVSDDGRQDFPPVNQNKAHRMFWLARILQRRNNKPARWLTRLDKRVSRLPAGGKIHLKELLLTLNLNTKRRPPLDPEFRKELVDTFRTDIERLSNLLQRDLSDWLITRDEHLVR